MREKKQEPHEAKNVGRERRRKRMSLMARLTFVWFSLKHERWVRNVKCRALGSSGVTGGWYAIVKQHHEIRLKTTRVNGGYLRQEMLRCCL